MNSNAPLSRQRRQGLVFMVCAAPFITLATVQQQPAFLAVGFAFLALGTVFLARGGKAG